MGKIISPILNIYLECIQKIRNEREKKKMLIYSHRYLSISYDLNFSDKRQKHTSILKKTLKKENKHIFCRVDSSKDPTDGSISLCNVPKLNRSPYVVLPFDLVSIFLLFFARGHNNTSVFLLFCTWL